MAHVCAFQSRYGVLALSGGLEGNRHRQPYKNSFGVVAFRQRANDDLQRSGRGA